MTNLEHRSLEDWLVYIDQVHPVGWDLGLVRVTEVGERLGVLHPAPTTILVAGTNGKGSTCEYLAAFAAASGLSCGKSTSPHLFRFNERIVIDDKPLSDAQISSAFAEIEQARGDVTLTYFEFASLASMLLFKQAGVDVAVLEIGLGGRLDAMNIVSPDLCIITAIALDHQAWLGDDREAIGYEKAGIMRPGISCLIADREPPKSIIDHAASISAPIRMIGTDFDVPDSIPDLLLPRDSFAVSLEAAKTLDWDITQAGKIAAETTLTGRRTWLDQKPAVLFDVAHNPAAAASLASYLESQEIAGDIHALVGMYADKDIEQVTALLAPLIKTWHLTALDDPRSAKTDELQDRLAERGRGFSTPYDKIDAAVGGIRQMAQTGDVILVFGSFPVVAGALPLFQDP